MEVYSGLGGLKGLMYYVRVCPIPDERLLKWRGELITSFLGGFIRPMRGQGKPANLHLIIFLILAAFFLRVWGISYGLPFVEAFVSDAERFVVDAVRIAGARDPNPHWFGHPGSTIIYPLAAIFGVLNRVERLTGLTNEYVLQAFQGNPTPYYVIGRFFNIACGVAIIPVVYLLGTQMGNRRVGLIAAWLLVISPLHVFFSQLARTDAPATFLTGLSLLGSLFILERPRWRFYLLASISAGLAASTKYNCIVVAICLPMAHILRVMWERSQDSMANDRATITKLVFALSCIPLIFAFTSPYVILDFHTAWADIIRERRIVHLSADGLSPIGNCWWYIYSVLPQGIGSLASLLVPIGLWQVIRHLKGAAMVGISFLAVFITAICIQPLHWDRWLIPALPMFTILAGLGLEKFIKLIWQLTQPRVDKSLLTSVLVIAVSLFPLSKTIVSDINRSLPDTRILTKAWIETHIPPGTKIAVDAYAAPVDPSQFVLLKTFSLSSRPLDYYYQENHEYLVVSSKMYNRFMAEQNRYPNEVNFYHRLEKEATLVRRIAPIPWHVTGPEISIYRLD